MTDRVHIAWQSMGNGEAEAADLATGAPHLAWAMAALSAVGGRCSLERLGGLTGEVFRFEIRAAPEDPAIDPFSATSLYQGFAALGYASSILCGDCAREAMDAIWAELGDGRPVLARGLGGNDWGMIVGLRGERCSAGVWSPAVTSLDLDSASGPTCYELVTIGPRTSNPAYPDTTREAIGRAIRRLAAGVAHTGGTLSGFSVGENAWAALEAWHDAATGEEIGSSGLAMVAARIARRRRGAAAFLEKTKREWLVAEACFAAAAERFVELASAMQDLVRLQTALPAEEARSKARACVVTARLREGEAVASLRVAAEAIRSL